MNILQLNDDSVKPGYNELECDKKLSLLATK